MTGVGAYAVEVAVLDARSGLPAAAGAVLLLYSPSGSTTRVDSVVGTRDADVLRGGWDRPGRYTVVVRKADSRPWTRSDVIAEAGCPSLRTVSLTARLEAVPPASDR